MTYYLSVLFFSLQTVRHGDVVVAKTYPPLISVLLAIVTRLKGATLVNWNQDLFPEVATALGIKGFDGRVASILRKVRDVSLHTAYRNIVLSDGMANRVRQRCVDEHTIRVIHNWPVWDSVTSVDREANSLRNEWRMQCKFVVGYSGNMGRAHEFATLLDAAEIMNGDDNIVFVFIGGGSRKRWIEQDAYRRKLKNIHFKPYQPLKRLGESLSVSDVHVVSLLPTVEGLIVPSKFYGILAVGRPVIYIGSERGDLARIITEEAIGRVVSIGDGDGLAHAIRLMAKDGEHTKEIGIRAKQVLDRRYSREWALSQWGHVLDEAMSYASLAYRQKRKSVINNT